MEEAQLESFLRSARVLQISGLTETRCGSPQKFPIDTIPGLVGINILAGVRMLRSRLRMNPEPSRRHLNLKGSQIIVGAGRERKDPLP